MHLILPRRRTNDFHILEITHNTLGHTPLSQASSSVLLHRHHLYFDFTFFVKKIQKAGYLVKTQHNAFVQAKIQGVLQIFKEFLKQFKDFSRTKAEILKFKEFSRTLPFFKDFSRPVWSMWMWMEENISAFLKIRTKNLWKKAEQIVTLCTSFRSAQPEFEAMLTFTDTAKIKLFYTAESEWSSKTGLSFLCL